MQSIVWQSMSNASQATSHASQATSNASQAMSNASQATSNASQATSKHIFTRSRDPEILVFLQVCLGDPQIFSEFSRIFTFSKPWGGGGGVIRSYTRKVGL